MNGKRFSENKARRNGFYLALAVCLVAVGIAAWSTYDAVNSYVEAESPSVGSSSVESELIRKQNEDVRNGQETEKQTRKPSATEDPEAPRTASPSPSRQTAGAAASSSQPEKPAVTQSSQSSSSNVESAEEEPASEDAQVPATAPLYERSSQMIYPLESQDIQQAYSAGAPVYSETMKDWRVHTGMDEKSEPNEEVHACANGQVKLAYVDSMLGNVLVIEHGDYEFSYCGLGENFLVKEGDIVTKGQAVGTVTAVPSEAAQEPHLHLEVKRDGVYLNPQDVIEGN